MEHLPVADPWFHRTTVGDGITHIAEPHVHPLLRCNVWHVRGRERDLVVDTSLGLQPLRDLVTSELGHDVLAVATHVHGDHVGGLHEFDRRAIHPLEAEELDIVLAYGLQLLEAAGCTWLAPAAAADPDAQAA